MLTPPQRLLAHGASETAAAPAASRTPKIETRHGFVFNVYFTNCAIAQKFLRREKQHVSHQSGNGEVASEELRPLYPRALLGDDAVVLGQSQDGVVRFPLRDTNKSRWCRQDAEPPPGGGAS